MRWLVVAPGDEPVLQLGPAGDQRLVGEIDQRLAGGAGVLCQEARIDKPIEDGVCLGGLVCRAGERGARLLPAGIRPALAEADQAQEEPAREPLLLRRQIVERGVGPASQRDSQAAAAVASQRLVAMQAQQLLAAAAPQLHQRFLQQRQRARLGGGVAEQPLD